MGGARAEHAFLLVEAMLTAVVIAVGLVFIGRGIGESLKALARFEERAHLVRLAEGLLGELETQAQHVPPLQATTGRLGAPDGAYAWTVATESVDLEPDGIAMDSLTAVTLTVQREADNAPAVRLQTVWPTSWLVAD